MVGSRVLGELRWRVAQQNIVKGTATSQAKSEMALVAGCTLPRSSRRRKEVDEVVSLPFRSRSKKWERGSVRGGRRVRKGVASFIGISNVDHKAAKTTIAVEVALFL